MAKKRAAKHSRSESWNNKPLKAGSKKFGSYITRTTVVAIAAATAARTG